MIPENIIETVLKLLNKSEEDISKIYIEAKFNEIMAYLNRDDVTDEMFPVLCTVIASSLKDDVISGGNVQSYSEGDMSVSYSTVSPYFGRLEAFKVIRGIKKECSEMTN